MRPSAAFASQLAVFVDFFGLGALLPILPFFLSDIEADDIWLGLILTFQQGAVCLGSIAIGYLSDRYGRKRFVLISLSGAITFFALSAFCQTAFQLLVVRSLAGFSTAVSPSFSWTLSNVTPETRAQAVARWTGALLLGIALGSSAGGLLGEYLGFMWAMLFCALLTTVAAGVVFFAPGDTAQSSPVVHPVTDQEEAAERTGKESVDLVKKGETSLLIPSTGVMSIHYLVLTVGNLVDGMMIMSSHTLMTLLFKKDYDWTKDEIGFMFATYAATSFIITLFVFKYVCDRLGALRLVVFGGVGKFLCFSLVGLVVYLEMPWYFYSASILVFGVVFNVSNPSIVVVISGMVRRFEPERMGTFVGWARSAFSLGQALGPVFSVELVAFFKLAPFVALAALSLLCALAVALLQRVDRPRFAPTD